MSKSFRAADDNVPVGLVLPRRLVAEIDAVARCLARNVLGARVTRSAVMKAAIRAGLPALRGRAGRGPRGRGPRRRPKKATP